MTRWTTVLIGILPGILGSSILIASFTALANELFNKTHLDISAQLTDNGSTDNLQIKNKGRVAAKDLILKIGFPKTYTLEDSFSTENMSRPNINLTSGLLEAQIPRFATGDGAIVILEFARVDNSMTSRNYTVYATYDGGSIKKTFYYPSSVFDRLGFDLRSIRDFNTHIFFWESLFALAIVIFTIPSIHKKIFHKSEDEKEFLSKITKDIMTKRSNLIINPSSKEIIPDNIWNLTPDAKKHQFLPDIVDFILIDDFYTRLMVRNSEVKSKKQIDYDIRDINKQCIHLGEKALKNIDWKKYEVKVGLEHKIAYKNRKLAPLLAGAGYFGLPGIGHIYIGRSKRGIIIMITGLSLYFTSSFLSLELTNYKNYITESYIQSYIYMILISSVIFFILYIWQIFNANKLAKYYNKYVRENNKKPW